VNGSGNLQLPPPLERVVMAAAKQRPAATPSRPSFAPRTKRVCPWRRSSRCPGETGRIKFGISPGHRAEPPPPAEQATTADADGIGSLPLKVKLRIARK